MSTSAKDMQKILQELTDEINSALLERTPSLLASDRLQVGVPSTITPNAYTLLPLISSETFALDLHDVSLPNTADRNLHQIIQTQCRHNKIEGTVPHFAPATAVVAALPGKKADGEDKPFQAEYAPFYNTELKKPSQRVLAITLREESILVDNLDVTERLPLSGRQNLLFKNFKAIEGTHRLDNLDIIIVIKYTSSDTGSETKHLVNIANTPAIVESTAPRTIENVAVYFLLPQVISKPTNKNTAIHQMCDLSRQLADKYRLPTFGEFTAYVNSLIKEVLDETGEAQTVSTHHCDVFEHSLLHLAGIQIAGTQKLPQLSFCAYTDPRGFSLVLHGSTPQLQQQVTAGLNKAFEGKHAFSVENNSPHDPRLFIYIPYSSIHKHERHATKVKQALRELFSAPDKLATYVTRTKQNPPAHGQLIQVLSHNLFLNHHIVPGRGNAALPIVLLKAFGWEEIPNEPKLLEGKGYFSEMSDSYLSASNMTPEAAQQIVAAINAQFPSETSPCAHSMTPRNSTVIVINAQQLLRTNLIDFVETRLKHIKQSDPLWFDDLNEEFRVRKALHECAAILQPLIEKYLSDPHCDAEIQLGSNLKNLLNQLTKPAEKEALLRASFAVTTSIALLESTLEPKAREEFKKGDKATIKSLQSEFGLRKTVTAQTNVANVSVGDLKNLAQQYEQSTAPGEQRFRESLHFFAQTLADPDCSRDRKETASAELTRSMAFLESTHMKAAETRFFKTQVKAPVKAAQKALAEQVATSEQQMYVA